MVAGLAPSEGCEGSIHSRRFSLVSRSPTSYSLDSLLVCVSVQTLAPVYASCINHMGCGTMKLRYFKDLICASLPDLFKLFSSVQKLKLYKHRNRLSWLFNLQEKEAKTTYGHCVVNGNQLDWLRLKFWHLSFSPSYIFILRRINIDFS